ncbi:5-carboxymethyl-2-hydroxymuconate Delta-isomerase [Bacillus sp. FJAT-42376]|uniref:5-carboxymethyl-2-hydroxymuconate Delta-isomerase n=1 Tax=Bacillus sp. FJAT-42376 TaxID=2014076 RepID=UPI000F4D8B27|nr:5-carboxymethyl-2-hydroxymuconate Delta-isomerase [Bacillus sp. FJAT-42376]AZB42433.1 5-carboxymethyl-2-hydroxymuconate Delta-isomerase [Bacillus sp. FJAT-42376]
MPHIIVEYTDNMKAKGDIPGLLKKINGVLLLRNDLFPIGGIRSRAIELTDYVIADGEEDDAFVHITMKIGAGRSEEDKKAVCDELFKRAMQHFQELASSRYFALSMELSEFAGETYKYNNIHERFKKTPR